MAKRKRTKRKKNQSNTSLAKRQRAIIKALSNKKQNQSEKDLTLFNKVWNYRKWISFSLIFSLVVVYFSYYPKNLIVSEKLVNPEYVSSNAIIIHNPNSYSIDNIDILVYGTGDIMLNKMLYMKDYDIGNSYRIFEIPAYKSSSVQPLLIKSNEVNSIENAHVKIVLKYKTPWLYNNIINDTTSFKLTLNSLGEIIYLPE
ncbi:hypothetical protein Q2T41_18935 [Maribacter confluentis]|uniref:Uncharacterized protein n=1 Tax=Maribacter confluentis TaxID=1656093 RepID=A0ABT8RVI5_9FLAO|nr:hypothetical protein [Maribacter confluentis]MDO1514735.1 hypothetical protein [Maribacter confluentis]